MWDIPTIPLGIVGWKNAMMLSTTVRYGARAITQVFEVAHFLAIWVA
jgi:hypothetical protein